VPCLFAPPPLLPRTNRTSLVPPLVLSGHAASLTQVLDRGSTLVRQLFAPAAAGPSPPATPATPGTPPLPLGPTPPRPSAPPPALLSPALPPRTATPVPQAGAGAGAGAGTHRPLLSPPREARTTPRALSARVSGKRSSPLESPSPGGASPERKRAKARGLFRGTGSPAAPPRLGAGAGRSLLGGGAKGFQGQARAAGSAGGPRPRALPPSPLAGGADAAERARAALRAMRAGPGAARARPAGVVRRGVLDWGAPPRLLDATDARGEGGPDDLPSEAGVGADLMDEIMDVTAVLEGRQARRGARRAAAAPGGGAPGAAARVVFPAAGGDGGGEAWPRPASPPAGGGKGRRPASEASVAAAMVSAEGGGGGAGRRARGQRGKGLGKRTALGPAAAAAAAAAAKAGLDAPDSEGEASDGPASGPGSSGTADDASSSAAAAASARAESRGPHEAGGGSAGAHAPGTAGPAAGRGRPRKPAPEGGGADAGASSPLGASGAFRAVCPAPRRLSRRARAHAPERWPAAALRGFIRCRGVST